MLLTKKEEIFMNKIRNKSVKELDEIHRECGNPKIP
jgi:hypothetical protein